MNPPTGTVTFLFTDIEGSTRLWEQYPEAMRPALARHDRVLRDAIQTHRGYVFKTVGDAFCAAFHSAADAVHAALEANLALQDQEWEETGPLRVRMGLHTGEAEERDNDYFGQVLNRLARLQGVGYGQQTLLSQVTYELVRDMLPPLTSVAELGIHRLKDLQRPELIFQLLHPALPSAFPPLKSLDNPKLPNNLPQQLTSFVGREKEMAEVKALLANTRLLTLLAMGGSGKTRLALQVAADLLDGDGDGVWFVELAALTDPGLVAQEAAHVLGVSEQPGKSITQCLTDHLKSKRLLLILDNCEHLIEACARLADTLLRNCPQVQVLATSREALGIVGEQTYRLSTLSVPQAPEQATASNLSQYEAVQLFIARALAVQPTFAITNANAPALAQICVHLDGIPLAIELAAARVRSLPLQEINAKLDQRFRLLTGGSRTALPRQQTLRALIDWSYDLLGENEKALLHSLSVFSGGWSLEAAERVCSGETLEDWEVFDLLTALVDKSLVHYEERREAGRYRLLETVRQYTGDRLAESGVGAVYRSHHREYYLALAEEAKANLVGPEQGLWLDRLETEHDNLRQALTFCLEEDDEGEAGLRLGAALERFWWTRGYLSEGRERLVALLARPTAQAPTTARADALSGASTLCMFLGDYASARSFQQESLEIRQELGDRRDISHSLRGLGLIAWRQGDYASAGSLHQESLEILRELGDRQGVAESLNNLGNVAWSEGDNASARSLYKDSLEIRRELGDRRGIAHSLMCLGNITWNQGDYASAKSLHQQSLEILRELGDRQHVAGALNNLGNVAWSQGDYASARSLYEESLEIRRELGDRQGIAHSLLCLGNVAHVQGDHASARPPYQESLEIMRELGDRQGIADSLNNLGIVAHALGDYASARSMHQESLEIMRELGARQGIGESLNNLAMIAYGQGDYASARSLYQESLAIFWELGGRQGIADSLGSFARLNAKEGKCETAARLWAAAERLREEIGSPLPPNGREEYDQDVSAARRTLGDEAFSRAWAEGQTMTMEQAIECALATSSPHDR